MNNEIRRLVRCIVEASEESNIQLEEIQAENAKQFGKEMQPHPQQDIEPEKFRKNVKKFLKDEIGHSHLCGKIENVIELFCVFYELRRETPEEDVVTTKKIIQMFTQKCHITEGTARGYFSQAGYRIKLYLKEYQGIVMKNNESINMILEEVYPFIVEM